MQMKICLILVGIQKILSFMKGQKKNVIGKIKDVAKVVSIVEYGEL